MARMALRDDKLLETAEALRERIAERFPSSGLSEVAADVVARVRDAVGRAASIARPNLPLRVGLLLLVLLLLLGLYIGWRMQSDEGQMQLGSKILGLLEKTTGPIVYLSAGVVYLVTLEVRLKRRKALRAIHELRGVAHIIDMHQLAKDPDRFSGVTGPVLISGKPMTVDTLGRYLHYCTELLAVLSKIGALYVMDFPDTASLAAVDQFESLTTGLSQKIWQKLMVLDEIRGPAATDGATTAAKS